MALNFPGLALLEFSINTGFTPQGNDPELLRDYEMYSLVREIPLLSVFHFAIQTALPEWADISAGNRDHDRCCRLPPQCQPASLPPEPSFV